MSTFLPLLVVFASTADARRPKVYTQLSGAEVAEIVAAPGNTVELLEDDVGDPLVTVNSEDLSYLIHFYDCVDDRCGSIQFRTWWTLEAPVHDAAFHTFAHSNRAGRVFLNAGKPMLEVLLPMTGGVTLDHVAAMHDQFLGATQAFQIHLQQHM